jgi:hypothetical protein
MPRKRRVWTDEKGITHLTLIGGLGNPPELEGFVDEEPHPGGRRPSDYWRIVRPMVADYVRKGGGSPGPEQDAFVEAVIEQCRTKKTRTLPDQSTVRKAVREVVRKNKIRK